MQFDISDKHTQRGRKKAKTFCPSPRNHNPSITKTLPSSFTITTTSFPSTKTTTFQRQNQATSQTRAPTTPSLWSPATSPPTGTMSPVTLDLSSDFHPSSRPPPPTQRTLLLAPPSLAADATRVSSLFTSGAFDRATTDLHMLDRLAAGLVALPPSTYDLVLVLAGDVPTPQLDRALWALLVPAVKPGGKVSAEDGRLSRDSVSTLAEAREAVLAGLVAGEDGFVKPDGWGEEEAVPIVFGLRKKKKENGVPPPAAPPKGVGFVDFSDDLDLDADDDDGLIDEDALLTEADLRRPVPQPPECAPQPGKKRRACKDCTCGLAERKFYSISVLERASDADCGGRQALRQKTSSGATRQTRTLARSSSRRPTSTSSTLPSRARRGRAIRATWGMRFGVLVGSSSGL